MEFETKERILMAAKREFSEKGFDGARMGAIARGAKVNQALIHYYFQSKENLHEQVVLRLCRIEQKNRMISFLDKYQFAPSERLYMEIFLFVKLYIRPKDPDFERILLMNIGRGGLERVFSIISKFFLPQFQLLENTLKKGVESGEFETSNTMFVIFELILFTTHYENFRKHFTNTKWFDNFYGKDYSKKAFDFLIEHTFKALCPAGKKVIIPSIPDSIIKEATETIDSIIEEMQRGQDVKEQPAT
ncbi:MAG: TetR/AcrR family transcriptional regulator [Spirochaetota bacterium]